jgi:hypothetical protein
MNRLFCSYTQGKKNATYKAGKKIKKEVQVYSELLV